MSGLAYVFPGQGSQSVGMLVAKSSEVAATYEEASEALGYDMGELISSGPEEVLNQTEYTQPALLTVSVALFRYAMNNNAEFPDVVLGHSLGEYAALVAAGAIRFEDAVKLVRRRGQYMQGAVPLGKGGMAAVLGLSDDMMREICESVTRESKTGLVEAANFNAPEQVVVAGDNETLQVLMERCRESGAKRSILLNVSAPFHCSLMKPAALKMEARLREIEIIASLTVVIFSASSSGISVSNSSSRAITNSTVSSESAPRSSTKEASGVTSSSLTPSCSHTNFVTRSTIVLMAGITPSAVKKRYFNEMADTDSSFL
tara:strand:- start:491 stop:1438 length:948 start_codon:yes stop_codon:yes gene_type:complete